MKSMVRPHPQLTLTVFPFPADSLHNKDHLLLLPITHLAPLLSTTLQLLTIHSLDPLFSTSATRPTARTRSAPAQPIVHHLETEYGVQRDVVRGVMRLCGTLGDDPDGVWEADLERMVTEIGKGLLAQEDVSLRVSVPGRWLIEWTGT